MPWLTVSRVRAWCGPAAPWRVRHGDRRSPRINPGRAPIYLPVNVAPGEWGVADTSDALFGKKVMHPREPVDWHTDAARSLLSIPLTGPSATHATVDIPILIIVANTTRRHRSVPRSPMADRAPKAELRRSKAAITTSTTAESPSTTFIEWKSSSPAHARVEPSDPSTPTVQGQPQPASSRVTVRISGTAGPANQNEGTEVHVDAGVQAQQAIAL